MTSTFPTEGGKRHLDTRRLRCVLPTLRGHIEWATGCELAQRRAWGAEVAGVSALRGRYSCASV